MENEFNNTNNFDELDELRQQITDLKEKVNQQGHLNEERMKKAVQGKMKGLHRNLIAYCVILGLFVPFMMWDFISSKFSWPFIIFTLLFFIAAFVAEYFINRMNVKHMTDDLAETARKLAQMKKNRKKQLAIGFAVVAVWTPWYFYEIYRTTAPQLDSTMLVFYMTAIIVGMVVGGLIGLAIGLSLYRKMQRTNDEMIDQINELTSEQ